MSCRSDTLSPCDLCGDSRPRLSMRYYCDVVGHSRPTCSLSLVALLRMVHPSLRIRTRIHHLLLTRAFLFSRVRGDPLRRPFRSSCMNRPFMRDLLRFGTMAWTACVQLPRTPLFASLSAFHVLVNLIAGFSFETALIVLQVCLLRRCILLGLRMRSLLLRHRTLPFDFIFSVRSCSSYRQ